MWNPEKYNRALKFAATCHIHQKYPGSEWPYLLHINDVTMEIARSLFYEENVNADLAIQTALLHDVIEDTGTSFQDVFNNFGQEVADGVLALSKNQNLPKNEQMMDSLNRILLQPKEIQMVKLADRISNLFDVPHYWSQEKIILYQKEAELIHLMLNGASLYLANRLNEKIISYQRFIK
jgi:(p)ppGpp synthase/HD superfamily hydrolase